MEDSSDHTDFEFETLEKIVLNLVEEPENMPIDDLCDCLLEIVKFFKLFGKAISLAFSGRHQLI